MILAKCDRCGTLSPRDVSVMVHINRWRDDETPVHHDLCAACGLELLTWVNSGVNPTSSDDQVGVIRRGGL